MDDLLAMDVIKIKSSDTNVNRAFRYLFDKYYPVIIRYLVYRKGLNDRAAEDIAQQMFINVNRNPHSFTNGSLISWLKKICDNLVIDSYRARANENNISMTSFNDESGEEVQIDIEDLNSNYEEFTDLNDCVYKKQILLAKKFPKMAEAISYLIEGYSNEEIAEFLEDSAKNFREFISQTRKTFMKYTEECFE
jgi:RNA polymerase sigma factor (sigma-70 family)